jgi:hypothetical protein
MKLSGVTQANVVEGQRARKKVRFESTPKDSFPSPSSAATTTTSNDFPSLSSAARTKSSPPLPKKKGKVGFVKIVKGDVVSVSPTIFDGDAPGSFSESFPERCFGIVESIKANGLVTVRWENDDVNEVKLKDLKRERKKLALASIIVLLEEGEQVSFKAKDEEANPKNFFELLAKANWRKWVEAVKQELGGWEKNNAVTVVPISKVPANSKIMPLGGLYTRKRDGRCKFRQCLMGNLLREGVDFADTFSTTISGSGICTFFSLATTCEQEAWGWDAVCGYLQCKE